MTSTGAADCKLQVVSLLGCPILWPVPNIKYILIILPCSQETKHENNHVVQLKLKGKRHCSTVMNWSTKSGTTLLGNHHPDLHRLVCSTTWKVLTGAFPQLRNNSHYVRTAVWLWGWLLVVFSSCEANLHRPIVWKQKTWQKKSWPNLFFRPSEFSPIVREGKTDWDKHKPLHRRHHWRWVHPGWTGMNHTA